MGDGKYYGGEFCVIESQGRFCTLCVGRLGFGFGLRWVAGLNTRASDHKKWHFSEQSLQLILTKIKHKSS